ncbi:hypothetical protein ONS95_001107 [Cadophora gregata]|uniref:uncharacterized protein n=1 Tax=Cadophora gregata TaxID=51156 RepID=UPI0026DAF6C9|nr:uncharacterized protein ONS95_001107 [Cadophora gregata]KAK0102094.1 hypothetical protein ONS96_006057 [Cadophora gregata f. sp. sojae]KAK0129172.1 hypothetical protein ONS95_001107 [Cadophora gregata]
MYRQFQVPENSKSSLPATAPDKLMHKILHPSSILTPGPLKETFQWKQKARASSIEACTLPSSKHLTQQIIRRVFVSSLRSNWRIDRLMFCASWFGRTKSFCICILVPFFLFGFSIAFSSFLDTYTPLHFSFSWLIPFDSFSRAGSLSSHLTMTPKYNIPLRILQAVFSIVVLALSSYVAFIQNQTGYHSATQINFLIFVSSFSLLSLLFLELAPRFAPKGKSDRPSPNNKDLARLMYSSIKSIRSIICPVSGRRTLPRRLHRSFGFPRPAHVLPRKHMHSCQSRCGFRSR